MLDADVEEEISLASAHTPEEGEGSEQEEEEQERAHKKRRLKKAAFTSTNPQLEHRPELEDDDSSSSSPMARDPVAATPLRMAPPPSAPGFGTLLNFHNLVDVDEGEDARYAFVLLVYVIMYFA